MKQLLLLAVLIAWAVEAAATCTVQWVDDDYNTMTPPVQKQICDSTIDIPAIPSPSVPPIQRPAVPPIQSPVVPPIGTRQCTKQQVYESGGYDYSTGQYTSGGWVTKTLCY